MGKALAQLLNPADGQKTPAADHDVSNLARTVSIREATVDDFEFIRDVHLDAFGKVDGAVVSKLAVDLLTDETAKPLLSLVADAETRISVICAVLQEK